MISRAALPLLWLGAVVAALLVCTPVTSESLMAKKATDGAMSVPVQTVSAEELAAQQAQGLHWTPATDDDTIDFKAGQPVSPRMVINRADPHAARLGETWGSLGESPSTHMKLGVVQHKPQQNKVAFGTSPKAVAAGPTFVSDKLVGTTEATVTPTAQQLAMMVGVQPDKPDVKTGELKASDTTVVGAGPTSATDDIPTAEQKHMTTAQLEAVMKERTRWFDKEITHQHNTKVMAHSEAFAKVQRVETMQKRVKAQMTAVKANLKSLVAQTDEKKIYVKFTHMRDKLDKQSRVAIKKMLHSVSEDKADAAKAKVAKILAATKTLNAKIIAAKLAVAKDKVKLAAQAQQQVKATQAMRAAVAKQHTAELALDRNVTREYRKELKLQTKEFRTEVRAKQRERAVRLASQEKERKLRRANHKLRRVQRKKVRLAIRKARRSLREHDSKAEHKQQLFREKQRKAQHKVRERARKAQRKAKRQQRLNARKRRRAARKLRRKAAAKREKAQKKSWREKYRKKAQLASVVVKEKASKLDIKRARKRAKEISKKNALLSAAQGLNQAQEKKNKENGVKWKAKLAAAKAAAAAASKKFQLLMAKHAAQRKQEAALRKAAHAKSVADEQKAKAKATAAHAASVAAQAKLKAEDQQEKATKAAAVAKSKASYKSRQAALTKRLAAQTAAEKKTKAAQTQAMYAKAHAAAAKMANWQQLATSTSTTTE